MTSTKRLGAGRYIESDAIPSSTAVSIHQLSTMDGAKVSGVLRTVPGAQTVVCLMHPRQDLTHHFLVPKLLHGGFAVWTQGSRSVNNDLALVHEKALLDVAAGMVFLRDRAFDNIVVLGHSGGGALYAFYIEQACLSGTERIARTPTGRPTGLDQAVMPAPDAAVFLASHPGQGELLLGCIDPSVIDEGDSLSRDPALDLYNPANGFSEPPKSSLYSDDFLTRYRQAQRERVARIDADARSKAQVAAEARKRYKQTGHSDDRREALAPRFITVYRTDADPRTVDLHIDPSERPYGSLFGVRPDLINYGRIGFGRLTTPEAWLSTWSGLSSNANFTRCASAITVPTLFVELTGDQAAFPTVSARMSRAIAARDKTVKSVRGTHFGGAITPDDELGSIRAGEVINEWLSQRFPKAS